MVKNEVSKMALSCHKLGGGYKSPEIKTVNFQSEGVVCVSGLTQMFKEQDFSNGGFWD